MIRMIHCPDCGQRLDVPDEAAGRMVRCPACKHEFRVPDATAVLDESVVCWLDLDLLDQEEDDEQVIEAVAPAQSGASGKTRPAEPQAAPPKPEAKQAPPARPAKPSQPRRIETEGDLVSLDDEMSDFQAKGTSHGSFVALDISEPAPRSASRAPEANASSHARPDVADARLRMTVVDVGAFGVRLGFDSAMFDQPGFRASLPMKCILCGESDPTKLIARPLAWIDRATGKIANAGEMEARYELHPRPQQSPAEVVEAMATLDELPPPFNLPIPYYVSRDCSGKVRVHCETVPGKTGVRCEVVIPGARYALDWFGRVNGVCGQDYLDLEAQVMKFEAKAWRSIPHEVRERLGIWFDFQKGEQFYGYFNDSDFARSDAGLAGLVVTDRRLVFCKYHHQGAIAFEQEGDIIVAEAGDRFVDLKYRAATGNSVKKLVRLRRAELAALVRLLDKIEAPFRLRQQKQPSA